MCFMKDRLRGETLSSSNSARFRHVLDAKRGATILGIQRVVDLIHDDQKVKFPDRFPRLDAFRRDDIGKPVQHGVAIGNEGSSGAEDGSASWIAGP